MVKVRRHLRFLTLPAVASAAWLVPAAGADALTLAKVTPNTPGKASRIQWQVDGTLAPINGQIPKSLSMSAPAGFTLDTEAVATRCTRLEANLNECPSASKIGTAVLTVLVHKPDGSSRVLPIDITQYLGKSNSLLAVAAFEGVQVVPGSIRASNGITVTFNPLPPPPVIAGVSYQFLGVTVDLGASRTVTRTIKHRVRATGKHVRYRVTHVHQRFDLVQNPKTCSAGGWALGAHFGLPDGTAPSLSLPVSC
jgi:hypothetical protein